MKLSIVTTMYHSAPYINEFYARICATAEKITSDYEIIFVNDGSPDDSLDIALSLYEKDPKVRVFDLSRNFGHHKAIIAGLDYSEGDLVFLIDCDLEEEPELLCKFYNEFNESDADVVYGVQERRKGDFWERSSGSLFYILLNKMCDCKITANQLTARLMCRKYVKSLLLYNKESGLFLAGLMKITGYCQKAITVKKISKGSSVYSIRKKIALLINSITSFTAYPLKLIFYFGVFISSVSFLFALYLILRKLIYNNVAMGWSSLMVSLWFVGGVLMMFMGIIGVYLAKIYIQVKGRPIVIVKSIYGRKDKK